MGIKSNLLKDAVAAHQEQDFRKAERIYRDILAIDHTDLDAIHFLGLLLHQQGRSAEGILMLQVAVERAPSHVDFARNLAMALEQAGRLGEAAEAFRHHLTLDANNHETHLALARLLTALRYPDEAMTHALRALELVPGWTEARLRKAGIDYIAGRLQTALSEFVSIANEQPDFPGIYSWLLACLSDSGQMEAVLDILDSQADYALTADKARANDSAFFHLTYDRLNPQQIFENTRKISRIIYDPHTRLAAPFHTKKGTSLTIGFIGGEFNFHVMQYLLLPFLAKLDHSKRKWIAYHSGIDDEITDAYRATGLTVIPVKDLNDRAVLRRIRNDGVDILIDINAHSGLNRLGVLARRAAPIQITWLGYAASTAMEAMDFRISDERIDPPGTTEHLHTEQLLRLPAGLPFPPPETSPEVSALPALNNGHVTFAVLNRPPKSARMISVYAEILARLPDARLAIITPPEADNADLIDAYLAPFTERGVRERVSCMNKRPLDEFLTELQTFDIALDSYPYSGGVTSFHTLWMGIPIVTRSGVHPISRVTDSIVTSLGYADWVTDTEAAFVDQAVSLAQDIPNLALIRSTLREKLRSSSWCDLEGLARSLETTLDGLKPAPFKNWGKIHNDEAKVFLHVGCGSKESGPVWSGYNTGDWQEIRLDIDPRVEPDIVASLDDLSPVPDNTVDAVWSSHNIEHLPLHRALLALREFFRVIKPGGELRLHLPDIALLGKYISEGALDHVLYQSAAGPIEVLDLLYGHLESLQAGNEFMAHRTGFSQQTLQKALEEAGFTVVLILSEEYELQAYARKPVV